jgi:hypothetical protein
VLKNGNTGIGTSTPAARLEVAGGSVLFSANATLPVTPADPPVSGGGVRMMWYADKAAFRVGGAQSNSWDKANIGNYSFATGQGSVASATASFATGLATASGAYATALGGATASGSLSTAMGNSATAAGTASTAIGLVTDAKAYGSISMGMYNDAADNPNGTSPQPADRIFQLGNGTGINDRRNALTVLRNGNLAIGSVNPARNLEVVAGPSSSPTTIAIANRGGFGPAALEFVSDYGLSTQWRPGYIASNDLGGFTGRLEFFTNGTGSNNLYGAVKGLEVRNGATLTATGSVGSFSDIRLKNNIEPFTDGLNVIEQINPVQFQYKPDAPFASPDKQVGIVAQELEKVAPYMVHLTAEGKVKDMRWVDNQAYVFLLINAVKELRQQVKLQQKEIEILKGQLR